MHPLSLVIHGGAGTIIPEDMTPDLEKAYINGLTQALENGYAVLESGGTAVDAIRTSIKILEDNILFNAGRGSVFTKKGVQEMDAAILDGKDLKAVAIAVVRNVRNPIDLGYKVLENRNTVF